MRWRLRSLFLALMAFGVGWIYLLNYVRPGRTLDHYTLSIHAATLGGALLVGLLLDAGAGYYLRPFFRAWNRLQACEALPQAAAEDAARLAMRFPEQSAILLTALSAVMTPLHRMVQYRDNLAVFLLPSAERTLLYSSMARDMMLALLLGLLLLTFSRRVLRPAVAAFGLRQIPDAHRFPIGARLALLTSSARFRPICPAHVQPGGGLDRHLRLRLDRRRALPVRAAQRRPHGAMSTSSASRAVRLTIWGLASTD